MKHSEPLQQLFHHHYGTEAIQIDLLTAAGSNRKYFRLTHPSGNTIIGVVGPNITENQAFIYLSSHFASIGLPCPQVIAISADKSTYLQEDLGNLSLHEALTNARESGNYGRKEKELLQKSLILLAKVQVLGANQLQPENLIPPQYFTKRSIMFDLQYFKYCFLKTTDINFDESKLEDDFEALATQLYQISIKRQGFLYRDYQARNLMLVNNNPYLIDYQSGRIGPPHYDVASFLWQSSARYPPELREELLTTYLTEYSKYHQIETNQFREELNQFIFFRTLQVLAAYGLRGRFERKPYFLASIPIALKSLSQQLETRICQDFPILKSTLDKMLAAEQTKNQD